jgi:transcriptional regulator with XRE-family HTH domain
MDKTAKLRSLIFEQYRSVREFSEKANLPYTTVHSILQRGIENSSVENVIKMCRALGITVDELIKDDEYYLNPESARIAQEAYDNPDLRILFDAAKDVEPEALKTVIDMVKLMKKKEHPELEDYADEFPEEEIQDFPED